MSKGQAARTSLCCSEEREEGDLPAWTWWSWRPRDGSAPAGSERTWSELTAHIQAHGRTRCRQDTRVYVYMYTPYHTVTHTACTHNTRAHALSLRDCTNERALSLESMETRTG